MGYNISSFDIINQIFTRPPQPPCTYIIALVDDKQNITMFQFLMNVLIAGAKKLYGENINAQNLTQDEFNTLKMYMESLGYFIKYNYTFIKDSKKFDLDPKTARMTVPELSPVCINIWFEPYIININCHGRPMY
jgi:hypothetical protein